MQDWLAARAAATPQQLALSMIEAGAIAEVTYRQLDEQAYVMAARLLAAGLRRGDRLGVLLPNGLAYAVLIHAALRSGLGTGAAQYTADSGRGRLAGNTSQLPDADYDQR